MGTSVKGLVSISVINGLVSIIALFSPMVELCFYIWHLTRVYRLRYLIFMRRNLKNMMKLTSICKVNRSNVNSMSIVNNARIFTE